MPKWTALFCSLLCVVLVISCQKEVLIAEKNTKVLGSAAHDLLSADQYSSLVVEIGYMPGYAPGAETIRQFQTFLSTYLNKPEGIRVVQRPVPAIDKEILTIEDLVRIEEKSRSVFTAGKQIAVYIMIVDAYFQNQDVFATSYRNTSFCLLGKAIKNNTGGPGQVSSAKLISTLLHHEFGHLLGLVDQGSPMQTPHRDHGNGAHCNNPACLMYYGIQTAENSSNANSIPSLDAACRADLKANGGR